MFRDKLKSHNLVGLVVPLCHISCSRIVLVRISGRTKQMFYVKDINHRATNRPTRWWQLRDPATNGWRLASGENRIGFALLSLVFIAASVLLFWP